MWPITWRDFNSTSGDYASHTIWAKMVYRLLLYLGFREQGVNSEKSPEKFVFFLKVDRSKSAFF